ETNDDEILVDHPRRSQGDVVLGRLAPQVLAQVDTAILAESRNRLSTTWIECAEAIHHPAKKRSLRSVGAIRESALRTGPTNPGIELPQHLPGRPVERNHLELRRIAIQGTANDQGIGFRVSGLTAGEAPGFFQIADVAAIDLGQRRVVVLK